MNCSWRNSTVFCFICACSFGDQLHHCDSLFQIRQWHAHIDDLFADSLWRELRLRFTAFAGVVHFAQRVTRLWCGRSKLCTEAPRTAKPRDQRAVIMRLPAPSSSDSPMPEGSHPLVLESPVPSPTSNRGLKVDDGGHSHMFSRPAIVPQTTETNPYSAGISTNSATFTLSRSAIFLDNCKFWCGGSVAFQLWALDAPSKL